MSYFTLPEIEMEGSVPVFQESDIAHNLFGLCNRAKRETVGGFQICVSSIETSHEIYD